MQVNTTLSLRRSPPGYVGRPDLRPGRPNRRTRILNKSDGWFE